MFRKLSKKFYSFSNLFTCLVAIAVMVLYAQFIMGGKAAAYNHLLTGGLKVPDLMFGYNLEYAYTFMLLLGPTNLKLYVDVVLIWDTIFPFVYTAMNVVLLSYIYRSIAESRYFWVNLLPLISIPLDLIENSFEIRMVTSYLNNETIDPWTVSCGSAAGMVKWCFTYTLYGLLVFGIVRLIFLRIKHRHESK